MLYMLLEYCLLKFSASYNYDQVVKDLLIFSMGLHILMKCMLRGQLLGKLIDIFKL